MASHHFDDGLDRSDLPVTGLAADYRSGEITCRHSHLNAQLIYAVEGVMVVNSPEGRWIVPPTRAIWMPGGTEHWNRMVGGVRMRTVFIRPDAAPGLPRDCSVIGVSPLLRELIVAAVAVPLPYSTESRDGRLMRLLLDEITQMDVLPLHLPTPRDERLARLCDGLLAAPDDTTPLGDWAGRLGVTEKTLQRLFRRDTGMTFGEWRQQARLLEGLEQLATGSKIVDVALNLGYSSPSAFATMFKRQFGVPPSAYFANAAGD